MELRQNVIQPTIRQKLYELLRQRFWLGVRKGLGPARIARSGHRAT
jgi:hypothetical protein